MNLHLRVSYRLKFQGKLPAYGSQYAMTPTIVIVAHYDAQAAVPVSKMSLFLFHLTYDYNFIDFICRNCHMELIATDQESPYF